MNPPLISSEEKFTGNIITVKRDTVILDNVGEYSFDIVEHPGGVAVIPVLKDNKITLIRQYRHPFKTKLIEIPAGRLNPNENPESAAKRELKEETGFIAENLEFLCCMYASPAIFNEKIFIYKATNLIASTTEFDYGENIESFTVSLQDALKMIKNGEIQDAKTIIAIQNLFV